MTAPLTLVLDRIARTVLGDADHDPVTIGAITLHAHQREALRRVRESIAVVHGALLADEPGLGKTFVALALARDVPHAVVVAPSALRAMWQRAATMAGVAVAFVSMEELSRGSVSVDGPDLMRCDLVIVDEAHHVCNTRTARYSRLARLIAYRRVLLLSATPVRNRRGELAALLALFMGPRAYRLDAAARARCIVRRSADPTLLPAIDGPHWHRVPGVPRVEAMIAALPPPLPARDGSKAAAFVAMSLARCWASSLAALDAALRRRLQRGAALGALLDDGRLPTRDELRAWVVGDDAVQLAFPIFAAHRTVDEAALRAVLNVHLAAARELRACIHGKVGADAHARARLLLVLRAEHPGSQIIAFTAHATTAEAVYRALARERGVALLTAKGARTAGGVRPRSDVIDALGSSPRTVRAGDEISLVIATDLLSEGVNLQGASVIVHLDTPWTPAGLTQRVGRAVRMGSRHARVHVHGIATPAGAGRLLRLERRHMEKRAEHVHVSRAPAEIEQLRAIVRRWCRKPHAGLDCDPERRPDTLVATARGTRRGCIAVIETRGERSLACGVFGGDHRWKFSDRPAGLCELARAVDPRPADPCMSGPAGEPDGGARTALERWIARRRARESSGSSAAPSRERLLLLRRLDAAVRSASALSRARNADRVAGVRALINHAVSAGAEATICGVAGAADADLDALLATCERSLGGASPFPVRIDGEAPAVRALLLLQQSS